MTAGRPRGGSLKLESLHAHFEALIHEIDRDLVGYLGSFEHPRAHYAMIQYHFGYADRDLRPLAEGAFLARGKRLRPILCMLFCRLLQLPADIARSIMMATEVMHSASLAHDDIEDKDAVRWGRPTVNYLFGLEQAINVGDALIGMVYQILLGLRDKEVPPAVLLEVIDSFNRAHVSMCEGQHLDLSYKFYDDVSVSDYLEMVLRKTAAPCVCIAEAITTLSGSSSETRATLVQFGQSLGMLYQICDDIRGIWSDPKALGRQVGQDVCQQRASLPLLYGFRQGSPAFRAMLRDRLASDMALSPGAVEEIRRELAACGADELCFQDANRYYRSAMEALERLEEQGPEIQVLEALLGACYASVEFRA